MLYVTCILYYMPCVIFFLFFFQKSKSIVPMKTQAMVPTIQPVTPSLITRSISGDSVTFEVVVGVQTVGITLVSVL